MNRTPLIVILSIALSFIAYSHAEAFSVGNTSIGPSTLYSGLVGWWTFDGGDIADSIKDRSGNAYDMFLSGFTSTTTASGKIGQAINVTKFGTEYLYTTTGAPIIGTGDATACMWMDTPDYTTFLSLLGNGAFYLQVVDNGKVRFSSNDNSAFFDSNISITNNAWWHICVVRPTVGNSTIYMNGQNEGSGSAGTPIAGTFPGIGLGAQDSIGDGIGYRGYLDDVRVYNRLLSAQEIAQLYNLGSAGHVNQTQVGSPGKGGLLAWYSFDGTGTMSSVTDASGNGNTATPRNFGATSTTLVEGRAGQALGLNSSLSESVLTPLTTAIGTASYAYTVWFKTSTSQLAGLISRRDNSGAPQFSLNISNSGISGAGNLLSIVDNDGTLARSGVSGSSVTDGKWHFAAIVRDTNTSTTLGYLDGSPVITSNSTAIPNLVGTDNIIVGAAGDGGSAANFYFNGSLDDARIYNRALSATEVRQIYNATAGSKAQQSLAGPGALNSGLVGWWTFDGPTLFTNVGDSSGQGNNGFMNGWTSTSSAVAQGKTGQALNFMGGTDLVSFGGANIITTQTVTVCAWMYPRPDSSTNVFALYGNGKFVFYISYTPSNRFLAVTSDGLAHLGSTALGTISANVWQHVCAVRKSGANGLATLYINGLQADAADQTSGTPVAPSSGDVIGALDDSSDNPFIGTLDDVRIYNRALSAAEIFQLYSLGR